MAGPPSLRLLDIEAPVLRSSDPARSAVLTTNAKILRLAGAAILMQPA